jgi:hypothetical protein
MTDFERRLRAAMAASAEPPPAGLLDGIRRRHRRHVWRVAVACVVAVTAVGIAAPLVTRGMLAGAGPAGISPAGPASGPTAAPGTVLRDCASNNNGTLGSDWKARSVHAGPVWFIYARPMSTPSSGDRPIAGKVIASAMVIAISNGRTAVVRTAPAVSERFRFLARFNGSGKPYTLAEGAPGLTLAGCPTGPAGTDIPAAYAPGLTLFWEGYVTGVRACVPLVVRTSPAGRPIRVTIAAAGAGCRS